MTEELLINNLEADKKSVVFLEQINVTDMKAVKLLAIVMLTMFSFNLAQAQPKHHQKKHTHVHHKKSPHHHYKGRKHHSRHKK
jgi:hypothetical protein